jgi:hypothetical protein
VYPAIENAVAMARSATDHRILDCSHYRLGSRLGRTVAEQVDRLIIRSDGAHQNY